MAKLFGGGDPFDDPFFTYPFDDMFRTEADSGRSSKEITIEEVDSDGNPTNYSEPSKELVVKNRNGKNASKSPNGRNANGKKRFSFQRVAYGGLNGMYYTASVTRKAGDNGVILMEINEEDKTMGQALNTISRGISDKGLSVTTRRTSDGKVDTVQTLHNLNEDELTGFEESWNANVQKLPPDWNSELKLLENSEGSGSGWNWWNRWPTWDNWALPAIECPGDAGETGLDIQDGTSSGGRARKIVPVNIE